MSYLENAKNMYTMIGQGQMMDAFEKYYHDKVVMEELGEEPRRGKEVNREFELKFLAMVKEFHGGGVDAIASNEDEGVTMVENWMDVSFMDGNRVRLEQVAVQRWDGDQIAYEKFYHK